MIISGQRIVRGRVYGTGSVYLIGVRRVSYRVETRKGERQGRGPSGGDVGRVRKVSVG